MNPFRYGSTVGKDDFCRRPELENAVGRHIESRQNIHIEGDRRTGKTSLVFEVCRKLKKNVLLHFDFQLVKSVADVRARLVEGLSSASTRTGGFEKLVKALAHLRPTISVNPSTGEPTISLKADDSTCLSEQSIIELLELCSSSFSRRTPVIFFDKFQDVIKLSDADRLLASVGKRFVFASPFLRLWLLHNPHL